MDAARHEGEAQRRCNICGRMFKNERGVKIDQGKSLKCKEQLQQRKAPAMTQRAISEFTSTACQSTEEVGQEANHSAPDLSAEPVQSTRGSESVNLEGYERKPRLNLPPAADHRWRQLDEDLSVTLDNVLKGDATKKMKIMVQTVH